LAGRPRLPRQASSNGSDFRYVVEELLDWRQRLVEVDLGREEAL
jgi:hypothetical protein